MTESYPLMFCQVISILTALGYIFVVLFGDKIIYRKSKRKKEAQFRLATVFACETAIVDIITIFFALGYDKFLISMPIVAVFWVVITCLAYLSLKNWRKRYDQYEELGSPEWFPIP